jgi:hypothetical protein
MFTVGQQVVCIDDLIPNPLAKHFTALPVKGKTYTIRAVYAGRKVMHAQPGAADGEIGVLLKELENPPDPRSIYGEELGFNAMRFRPLQELTTEDQEPAVESFKIPVLAGAESYGTVQIHNCY